MKESTRQKILQLIAESQLEDAIELLLSAVPEKVNNEIILQSSRLKALQKDIRLGLIDYENQNVTRNQIVYGILEMIKVVEGDRSTSILVAGTGKYNLPKEVYWFALSLGQKLGQNDFRVITGGWEGVDYVVAEEYAQVMIDHNKRLSEYLVQVVIENTEPIFKGGNLVYVKQGLREWIEAIKYCDIVILIGGEGGTYETFVHAHQEARPVFPIGCTGGDAKKAHQEIMKRWEYWSSNSLKGIKKEDFESLNQKITNQSEANEMTNKVIQMIQQLSD